MHKEPSAPSAEGRYVISTVDTALEILNLFYEREELGMSDIARAMEVSRSTAFRFLTTLERRGFLTKTDGGKYRLGLNLFSLGMVAHSRMELVNLLHPYLERVAADSGETCHLAVLSDGVHVMFIDRAVGPASLKMDTALGYSQVAHCTATGKAILANLPEPALEQYLRRAPFPRITEHAIPDAAALRRKLRQVRAEGYGSDEEEAELGLTCYGVPLLDGTGRAIAAVSISGPTTRMAPQKQQHLARLGEIARAVQRRIG